jgi:hypothetical protein
MCLLGCSIILGCATIPPAPETPITLPVSFQKVWFRPTLAKPGIQVMTDTGTVVVGTNGVSFTGKKGSIDIDYTTMQEVSFGKVGLDFINKWVTIKYQHENVESYALFCGGKALGWGGFKVAAQIFQTLDSALQQKGLSSIVQRK